MYEHMFTADRHTVRHPPTPARAAANRQVGPSTNRSTFAILKISDDGYLHDHIRSAEHVGSK